uniref:Protein kinase domain-containing protein n=1 Tax=Chromera velia CCMP2878 TaxID=1169474 RepID=A0A0G4HBN4_9ALVE|eukprot:Cvel_6226.t1-p1 / transcript=Cvel_6226.t1 / gene=Cvel_6226 / organism=Chromera_velia_CCMP2878 / gene_product=Interleukin-1 receptor-associated kinase 1, putative / transcript_product=Interleukin-1 receptor-associated kinase 1, putative / location=Cvel_scaffold301:35386-37477(+) / protein_length=605 / sequence_SO=supercontig / SO=protein_coding / is_pseudo=false
MPRNLHADGAAVSVQLRDGIFVEDVPLSFLQRCTLNFAEERKLGSDAFGTVYKGVDTENIYCFAVKVLNLQLFLPLVNLRETSDDALQKIIKKETEAFRALPQTHPNLCKLLGVCSGRHADQSPYVMVLSSLRHKGDLAALLKSDADARTLTWRDRVSVARQLAKAVSFLHGQTPASIFHRDLKSENVVMTTNLTPMLIDWALARLCPSHPRRCRESQSHDRRRGRRTQSPPRCDLVKQFTGEDLCSHNDDAPPTVHTLCAADADPRAEDWDEKVAIDFASLTLECLRKKRRRAPVPAVLRALCAMEHSAEALRPGERVLREELAQMREARDRELVEADVRQQRAREETVSCSACMETVREGEGVVYPRESREHFLCRECFSDYVRHQVEGGLEMKAGALLLPCPMAGRGCTVGVFFDQRTVALNCSTEAYCLFLECRDGQLRAEARAEVEAEVRREGAVGVARRRLEEELNRFCRTPCCNQPFVYEGCAAVTCRPAYLFCDQPEVHAALVQEESVQRHLRELLLVGLQHTGGGGERRGGEQAELGRRVQEQRREAVVQQQQQGQVRRAEQLRRAFELQQQQQRQQQQGQVRRAEQLRRAFELLD